MLQRIAILQLFVLLFVFIQSPPLAASSTDSPEAKFDKFMTEYMTGLKAAFNEKDDKKAATMLKKLRIDMQPQYDKLIPELKAWQKSMTKAEEEAWKKRVETKPWLKFMMEFGFSTATTERIQKSPEIKKEMDELSGAFKDLNEEESGEDEATE